MWNVNTCRSLCTAGLGGRAPVQSGTHGTPTCTEADSIHNLAILRSSVLRESATGPCPGPLECSLTSQNLLRQHSNQLKSVYLDSPLRERHNARQHRPVRISVNKKNPSRKYGRRTRKK